ncbi:MAG: CBS domain-containing protein [Polyangiaceae bacterium]|nr:CBS domain-containing protein [Polyangiaceae bacterium]
MSRDPHTIGRDQPMRAAYDLMRRHRIRHLPVLDGGRLVGVVSLGDLRLVETSGDVDPASVPVEEAMSAEPYAVPPDTPVAEVAEEMAARRYGCAIVVDGHAVVGVFTTIDALRALVGRR